jgi:peptidoglycan/xylan/chitin deacetylase (PgdA/CDA1 family)
MWTRIFLSALIMVMCVLCSSVRAAENVTLPNGEKVAVSLSYDDALDSQLDNAIPSLNKHNFKASFYILPTSGALRNRLSEWRDIAMQGHELGNHTIYHACSASLPDREWVKPYADLDNRSVEHMREEIIIMNTFLQALDEKTERTFTIPCGDMLASGENYLPAVYDLFVAIKGQGLGDGTAVLWAPSDVSGADLIDYIEHVGSGVRVINIIFHGIGGDYLTVSTEAHDELLQYLADHRDTYWVDTYLNIMKHINSQRSSS